MQIAWDNCLIQSKTVVMGTRVGGVDVKARESSSGIPGPGLDALRGDRVLWGLAGAVAACLVLALALMAVWDPAFGGVLLAAYLPMVAAVVLTGRSRAEQRDRVVRTLAIAVGQGLPLPASFVAAAETLRGRSRGRLLAVARLLEAGAPLPEALELVPGALPRDVSALLGVAWRAGRLAQALRETSDSEAVAQPIRAEAAARVGYLLVVFLGGLVVSSFIMYFIMPKFEAIFFDFGLSLPRVTTSAIHVSHWVFQFGWPIFLLLAVASVPVPVVVPLAIGGWIEVSLPGADRLFPARHTAPVLRALAWVVESGQPLSSGVAGLVRHYPSGWVRGRLQRVLSDLNDGADAWESLRERGLIRPADAAVLESARRVGNLPWALRETAEGAERRSVLRLQAWLWGLSTVALLLLGTLVLFMAVTIFAPLVTLIRRAAG